MNIIGVTLFLCGILIMGSDGQRRNKMKEKRLWVIEFQPGRDLVPEPRFWPDFETENIEVVLSDQFYAIVEAEYDRLKKLLQEYPYLYLAGEPRDGKWTDENGNVIYIYQGELVDLEALRIQEDAGAWDRLRVWVEKLGPPDETIAEKTWYFTGIDPSPEIEREVQEFLSQYGFEEAEDITGLGSL